MLVIVLHMMRNNVVCLSRDLDFHVGSVLRQFSDIITLLEV